LSFLFDNYCTFITKNDKDNLKKLGENKNIIITKADKGGKIVIMNKDDYNKKMYDIISDTTKFSEVNLPASKIIFKEQDKVNNYLRKLKSCGKISDDKYKYLYASGSSLGSIYGLPKLHKKNIPCRPVLASYNLSNYRLGRFLIPLIKHLSSNEFCIKNSGQFCELMKNTKYTGFMCSFDVSS